MNRIKMLLKLTAQAKNQSVSMRRKLVLYWVSMAMGILAAMVLILSLTGAFSNEAKNARESLQLQLNNLMVQTTQHMESLTAQSITLSQKISRELNAELTANGLTVSDLNNNPELLRQLQMSLFERLNTTMQLSQCSGAYLILDATTNTATRQADHSASGMYLRYANLNAMESAVRDVVYFRGIPDIAREEKLKLHNRWNLEFDTALFPDYAACLAQKVDRLADACSWSSRVRLTDTWEDVILLRVPVLAADRTVCGLCGVELSSLYCYLSFPKLDSAYGPMVAVLAPVRGDRLLLGKGMTGGADETFLGEDQVLNMKTGTYFNTYSSKNGSYIGLHQKTTAISADGTPLNLCILVPMQGYAACRDAHKLVWILGSLGFFGVMMGFAMLLSRKFLQPILHTIQVIQNDTPAQPPEKTGISELDALVEFVTSRSGNRQLAQGTLPPNIEELFDNFARKARTLTTAERTILGYYIDGHEIMEIPDLAFISIHTVKKHNGNIYQKLGIASRDELMLYIELFRRCDRLKELTDPDPEPSPK